MTIADWQRDMHRTAGRYLSWIVGVDIDGGSSPSIDIQALGVDRGADKFIELTSGIVTGITDDGELELWTFGMEPYVRVAGFTNPSGVTSVEIYLRPGRLK